MTAVDVNLYRHVSPGETQHGTADAGIFYLGGKPYPSAEKGITLPLDRADTLGEPVSSMQTASLVHGKGSADVNRFNFGSIDQTVAKALG